MNFSSDVSEIMKPFIKSFGKCDKVSLSKEQTKTFQGIIKDLYQDMYESSQVILAYSNCLKHTIVPVNNIKVKRPSDFNSTYFPLHIQTYIIENELYQLQFSCNNVGGREINIIITLFMEEDLLKIDQYIEQVKMMYMWLNICDKYADKHCTRTLNVYIYPTPFNKNLPPSTTTVLGPDQVNTAFTSACAPKGQIIVFREEEWFKVFIHETFHAYGLDFATSNGNNYKEFKKQIAAIFPIKSDFDLYEAYTETWARIINCLLCSFNSLENKKDKKAFMENFLLCIELERMFALYQCIKVLSFMGLHYKDLHMKENTLSAQLYNEDTHVFAYYVMTAVFLNDYEGFLLWCRKNNTTLMKFNGSDKGFQLFLEYIKSTHNCESLQQGIVMMGRLMEQHKKNTNAELVKSTRMSLIQ